VSEGCRHCYAERQAARFVLPGMAYEGLLKWQGLGKRTPTWNGKVAIAEAVLDQPLRKKQPRRIFVNSMSDLFHESVSNSTIAGIFGIMAACPQHTFQVLTKRPARMLKWFQWIGWQSHHIVMHECTKGLMGYDHPRRPAVNAGPWPLPNVWLGVSLENQSTADERIPLLLECPAAVRWLSCEPLLGSVDLRWFVTANVWKGCRAIAGSDYGHGTKIDWVVAGGESGPGARPMHPDWARSLRDQCASAGVPFFFKQWGAWGQYVNEDHYTHCGPERQPHAWVDRDTAAHGHCWLVDDDGGWSNYTGEPPINADGQILERVAIMGKFGKREAGRLLDGVEHNAFPKVSS
jgi:protein gp37